MIDKINSPPQFMELLNGFRISRIILTAHELNIFSSIGSNALPSSRVAEIIRSDGRATDRLLNALTAVGLLHKKEGMFSNTPFGSRFLVKGQPEFMEGLSHFSNLWNTWSTLTDAVKKGGALSVTSFDDRGEGWLEPFIAAMHSRGVPQAREVAGLIDLKRVGRMLDIGGGSGAFTFEFIRQNPQIRGVILDLPSVIPLTERYIQKEGMAGSVMTLAGDYHDADFGREYDLVYISAVIHINSPEENLLLIKKSAAALNPGGQLVIMDHIMSEDRTEPAAGAVFALNMLVGTMHGDTYTENEVRNWMQDAELFNVRKTSSPQGTCLMIGKKK